MREKTVYPVDMVAHLWAHKRQDSARNPGRNFYFSGDTIYSYGSHFPIAHHVENKRGESAVLLTTRSYSVTTSGHTWTVQRACEHLTVFHVPDVDNREPRKQFADYRARYMALVGKYAKARQRKPEYLPLLRDLVEEANRLCRILRIASALDPARRFDGHGCRVSGNREEGTGTEATGRAQAGTGSPGAIAEVG